MKDLIKKILKEETEEVLVIPSLSIFPDGIEGLKNFIQKKNIKKWSLDDDLDLSQYKGDLAWLEGLVSVSGDLDLFRTSIESLPNLQSVGRSLYLYLYGAQIESLGNLQSVGGDLNLSYIQIESLGNLQSVGRNLYLRYTSIKSLGNLQSVGGFLSLIDTPIESLGNLQYVGDNLYLSVTPIKSFGNLKSVGGSLSLNKYLSKKYTNEEIKSMINVGDNIIRP